MNGVTEVAGNSGKKRGLIAEMSRMDLHYLTLRFKDKDLERTYVIDYDRSTIDHIRASLVLGLIVYASFGILDIIVAGDNLMEFLILRFPVAMGFNLLIIALTFSKRLKERIQLLVSMDMLVSGLAIVGMIIISVPPVSYYYYAGLILVVIFTFTIIRLRHTYAMATTILIILFYEIGALYMGTPRFILISNNFFFITSFFIGALASYLIEFYSRRDFYLSEQLRIEKRKVESANRDLERKIKERTADIRRSMDEAKFEKSRAELYMDLITHDMGNINQGLLQSFQVISMFDERPEKRKEILEGATKLVKRGSRLISNIQKLSVIRTRNVEKRPVDPMLYIRDAVKKIKEEEGGDVLDLKIVENVNEPLVMADDDLFNIFYTVIHNAYNVQKDKRPVIEIETSASGRFLRIDISDHGKGIPDSFKRILFDRSDMIEKKMHSGIGLTLVKALVSMYEGRITVDDRVEGDHTKGARFILELKRVH